MSCNLCSHCHYCKSRLMFRHYTSYLGLWFRCYHHCPHTFSGPVGAVRCLRCVSVPAPGSGLWLCGEALVTDGSQLPVKNRICAQAGCGCLCRVTAACALSFTRARAELTNQSPRFRQWTNQSARISQHQPVAPRPWPVATSPADVRTDGRAPTTGLLLYTLHSLNMWCQHALSW